MLIKEEIGTIIDGSLYAIHWEGDEDDCFSTLLDTLTDAEYLYDFFNSSKEPMNHYGIRNIEKAVRRTQNEMRSIANKLLKLAKAQRNGASSQELEDLFSPLFPYLRSPENYLKAKLRGIGQGPWIRLYAVRIEPNVFCITGGGIKTSQNIKNSHLAIELEKFKLAQLFLKEKGLL